MEIRALGLAPRTPGILHGVTRRRPTWAGDCYSRALEEKEDAFRCKSRPSSWRQQAARERRGIYLCSVFFSVSHSRLLIHPVEVRGPLSSSVAHSDDDSRAQTKTGNASQCVGSAWFRNTCSAHSTFLFLSKNLLPSPPQNVVCRVPPLRQVNPPRWSQLNQNVNSSKCYWGLN